MKLHLIASAVLAFGMVATSNAAEPLVDFSPLYKDVVAANEGIEMIHPYIKLTDVNPTDGIPEAFIRFNVYPAASNVPLFSTSARNVPFPAMPCTTPIWGEYTIGGGKFQGANNLERSHMAVTLISRCTDAEGDKEKYKTVIYSASVNVPPTDPAAAVWMKVYPGSLLGFDGAKDFTGDGFPDLLVSVAVDETVAVPGINTEPMNLRSIALQVVDGAVLYDVTRILAR